MTPSPVVYNERSWASDLIAHLQHLAQQSERSIRHAGGELTIRGEEGVLFPDVLLFGDRSTARILQGWELKMPDTGIDDVRFREDAEGKARALGLDSFLLWNVSRAHLYVHDQGLDKYVLEHVWSDLDDITHRTSVEPNRQRWKTMAVDIVSYLNDLFDRGVLEGRPFVDSYRSGGITALLMENSGLVERALRDAARRDAQLRAELTLWWATYRSEYLGTTMEGVLAQAVIANWIAKILFAHVLREKDDRAQRISDIGQDTTPSQALELFRRLSRDCNFWTIFSNSLGLAALPDKPWRELKQFNRLLADLRVGSVDQSQLAELLNATVEVARRKLRGQYSTPMPLARILVNLCVRDIVSDRLLDPCCGSGTIARAAIEQKLSAEVSAEEAAASVFAGDEDPQAAQIATFAVANASLMSAALRIFQRDAFTLAPTTELEFRDPSDGTPFLEQMGTFEAISCNLPFVAQGGRARYEDAIRRVGESVARTGHSLPGRADIAAYLPFALHSLLVDRGRLGIVITNAWLGTDWGDKFYQALTHYYDLKYVITSGAGRWFQNSEVVTNILVLEKKAHPGESSGDVSFVVLRRPLEELEEEEDQRVTSAQIEIGQTQFDTMSIRSISPARLTRFRACGLGGSAQFVHSDWILALPLAPLNQHFEIRRGERRGMNALFYPAEGHDIEAEYIRPLAKSPGDFVRLTGQAAREAFSCSLSKDQLREFGHDGALRWIEKFETPDTIERLSRTGLFWYEMRTDSLTELVIFINYGERIFVGKLDPPAFVDQRMVSLVPRSQTDVSLYHALLNCSIGMFIIEGMGFGRGLGALDINKDRIESYMNMLDPNVLDGQQVGEILRAFAPLLNRDILGIADELEQRDRQIFDDTVIGAFALDVEREQIYEGLRALVGIRATANT